MDGAPPIYQAAQVLVYPEERPALKNLLCLLVTKKSEPLLSIADFRGGAVSAAADHGRPSESAEEEEEVNYASFVRTTAAEDDFSCEVRAKTVCLNDLEEGPKKTALVANRVGALEVEDSPGVSCLTLRHFYAMEGHIKLDVGKD
nr:unnamed protein product [Spirometra erinaceieuropaei]